jgi:hypothetical protein
MKTLNLAGQKFGRLTVIEFKDVKNENSRFLCKCDCGNEKIVYGNHLKTGNTQSCGCMKKENMSNLIHGLHKTRFYEIWRGIKTRCLNKNHRSYKYYGKKEIEISDDWLNFEKFKKDMYKSYTKHCEKFGEKDTTIDRIKNTGNYTKNNCRWATWELQFRNKSGMG